jgi:hypothetical protein
MPDNSRKCSRRLSHLGLASNARTPLGRTFPHAFCLASTRAMQENEGPRHLPFFLLAVPAIVLFAFPNALEVDLEPMTGANLGYDSGQTVPCSIYILRKQDFFGGRGGGEQ